MANGCVCKLIGDGLMILLSGISGLGIFVRWKLPRMLGILYNCWRLSLVSRCLIWDAGLGRLLFRLRKTDIP